jgi:hypothetical protein
MRSSNAGMSAFPVSFHLATQEQIVLWRSAIVEIVVFSMNSQAPRERVIGRGVVISSDGMILSQMSVNEDGDLAKVTIKARFDDGTVIPLKLIEEAGQGWSVLQPELPIDVNHYFELSTSEVQLHDEVRVWGPEDSFQFLSESLGAVCQHGDRSGSQVSRTWNCRLATSIQPPPCAWGRPFSMRTVTCWA